MKTLTKYRVFLTEFTIFQKLVATFLLALIPILVISFMMNISSEATIRKDISTSMNSRVHFYLSTFETDLERIIRMKQRYMVDEDVQNLIMFHQILPFSEQRTSMITIQEKLRQFRDSSLFVQELKLFIPELNLNIQDEIIDRSLPSDEIAVLEQLRSKNGTVAPVNNELILGDSYPKYMLNDHPPDAWLEVVLSTKNMESSLKQISQYNDGEAIIFDNSGNWSLGVPPEQGIKAKEMLGLLQRNAAPGQKSGVGRFELNKTSYYFAYEYSELLNGTLMVYVPESQVLGPLDWYKRVFWILAVTSTGVILFFSLWIYRLIHQPMYRLTSAFRRLEKGEFQLVLSYKRKDEFRYLYEQFNNMTQRLKQLIQDVYEQELRSNRAELKQLQSQINPHFLYNIFFLLNRILQFEDIDNAKAITRHLGSYFRYITRNSKDEVALEQEMEHIRYYISIQTIRFGRRLHVELDDLPKEASQLLVPKLILQPIVENAFEYGLEEHAEQGILHIRCLIKEEAFEIHIEENGKGLTGDELAALSERLNSTEIGMETTGIINVHRRLQLSFGKLFGLHVTRSALGGVLVTVRVPLHPSNREA
ncbi:two-component system, sensor histidine kinase YesM [Paenibacillus sp. yr247]|uniref:histidine kinase n=1 Tax=Paenibacillus sp. yr247 TaxID=1761880 RepID=UPI00088DF1AF|nr:histidine kinase [Paenibacillus sp. yr247]SDO19264.1 two-component system, sensor histidine kinase YesM [Paenibacillus sp. yr247]